MSFLSRVARVFYMVLHFLFFLTRFPVFSLSVSSDKKGGNRVRVFWGGFFSFAPRSQGVAIVVVDDGLADEADVEISELASARCVFSVHFASFFLFSFSFSLGFND